MVHQEIYSPNPTYASIYTPPPKRPSPNPLQRAHRPSPLILHATPPTYKTHQFSPAAFESASAFFTPAREAPAVWGAEYSPTSSAASSPGPITPTRIFMGGIVSPRCSEDEWDEKLGLSIDVPGIVLTEPYTNPTRIPSPPPKTILLLPPTSLSLPSTDPTSPSSPFYSPYSPPLGHLYSPAFAAIVYGESRTTRGGRFGMGTLTGLGVNGVRTVVFGLMLLLGGWHLFLNVSAMGAGLGRGAAGWEEGAIIDQRM